MRLLDQRKWRYFLTFQEECHGVSFEIHDGDWYSEPSPSRYVEEMKRARYWRDEHPLGVHSFYFTVAVNDLEASSIFFSHLCGTSVEYESDRPPSHARAVRLRLGDTILELLSPTGDGDVRDFVERNGERIRSVVFAVKDMTAVQSHFGSKGVPLILGDHPGGLAVLPASNLGVLYEFVPAAL